MDTLYVFVLSKENAPKSKYMIPLDEDITTQPDVILTMEYNEDTKKFEFETTKFTKRVLDISK